MTIKKKIYSTAAVAFVLFVVLALMTIWTHQQVLSNLRTRDQVNEKLADVEKFVRWKNELIRSISDIVASGHVPPFTDEQFHFQTDDSRQEYAVLARSGRTLVFLIGEKELAVKEIEKTFKDLRIQINGLYFKLDKNIATVLALAQMDQVLGTDASEKSSLAPYVLKSLNQLTLVAQNGLISRKFSAEEMGVVARNRRFLSSQLHTIDTDGSIGGLFDELFELIESIEAFIQDSNQTLTGYNARIAAAKNEFDQAVRGTEIQAVVEGAQSEVKRANKALQSASQRTLTTVIVFLLVVPVLVIVLGIIGLNSTIVGPITSLVAAMKDVEKGRFDVTAPIKTQDEIGTLARAFNAMAAEIRSKVMELSRLNQVLTESEAKYRTLVDNIPQKIFLKNRDLSYISCNRNFARDLGIPEEEITGKTDYDFFSPELSEKYRHDDQRVLQTETAEVIEETYIHNEEALIVQTIKTPVRDESGNVSGVLGIFWDITERKRVEEELHLARFSLENASVATFWIDADGRMRYVNERACTMLGYDRNELLTLYIWDIDPEFGSERYSLVWREMSDGEPIHFESIQRRKDGATFPVEISVRQSEFRGNRLNFAFINDITERKEAERTMLESRELHQSIIQTAMDGFWVVDLEGRLLEVNEAYCRMSGYSEQELLSMHVEDLEAEAGNDVGSHIRQAAASTEDRFETRHKRKDGGRFDVEISVQYRVDHGGRLVCFLRDVTERKKLETQLLQAQKMEAVGTLAGGIAHDFNNLLQAISGYTQILLLRIPENDPGRASLEAIQKAGDRAADLVKQLLLFSRKAEAESRPINLNLEMEQARRMLERTIPKMIDIQLRPGGRLWSVSADPVQMEQILLNLGKNAADAMVDGGTLTFETENVTLDEKYAQVHLDAEPGRFVLLTVSDTGHGMDAKTMEHIFEPFYTTKGIGEGTGLGLASVYGIVKNHGGSITCYSEIGRGATFKIYLPAIAEESTVPGAETEETTPQGGTETILIVDDEEPIRDFASQIVQQFGYCPLAASCGEEAVEMYSHLGHEIDLVILDIGMPGMGGHKCLQELLEIDPEVKVLIASGYSVNGEIQQSLDLGAAGYVGKPYRVFNLMKIIRSTLDKVRR